ncbi:P-loop containing nucleoside triphosphate hydrolase protein [Rhizoclosmatium globosum]|uniref:p-loop containing nucleoside triphosphate hydrolase protein n=1 Tax=Rhizoclosmatium globosum TaxID=329046 RepID=A0A1Y2C4T0_9FUNG|nr:P-loop containing nucleoside triphosphate hydrolase protein [Rhizoclosmatium globosum]|eukprot:ORY41325.1 P-loop containing nucleoside triphosphate hydrolase protein [Rhizoclosmatium globosum]
MAALVGASILAVLSTALKSYSFYTEYPNIDAQRVAPLLCAEFVLFWFLLFVRLDSQPRLGLFAAFLGLFCAWLSTSVASAVDGVAVVCGAAAVVLVFVATPDRNGYRQIDPEQKNPKPEQSLLSRFSFGFMSALMKKGTVQTVTAEDLYDLDQGDRARHLFTLFESRYYNAAYSRDSSLFHFFWSLIPFFGVPFLVGWIFLSGTIFMELIQPKLIEWILGYLTDEFAPVEQGYRLILIVFLVAVLSPPIKEQYFNIMLVTGVKIRTGLVGAIYKKSLRLSPSARQQFNQGYIQTLQSVDSEVLNLIPRQIYNGVWKAFVSLTVAFILLYQQIGWAFLPGFFIVVISSPIQLQFTNRSGIMDKKRLEAMDKRIRLMGEVLKGILVIKFNCLVKPMQAAIKALRLQEMEAIRVSLIYQSLGATVWQLQPFLIALSCFGTYSVVLGNPLTPQKTFTTLALLGLMNRPMNWLRNLFVQLKKIMVSARRIDAFLKAEEIQETIENEYADTGYVRVVDKVSSTEEEGFVVVFARNAASSWSKEDPISIQLDQLSIKKGELLAIVGRTGEGKTSLISMLLGEMHLHKGLVKVYGKIAYVSQKAWILSGTIRDNIIFGNEYDPVRYASVLETCALLRDLTLWPAADQTEIGERGVNLSGGQKQRISLARALYSNADVYFLDDPLSALDAHVGKHVFDRMLAKDGALAGKTRVLVTHGIHHLPTVDKIWVVKDGQVVEKGTYSALVKKGGEFAKLAEVMEADEDKMREAGGKGVKSDDVVDVFDHADEETGSIEDESTVAESVLSTQIILQDSVPKGQLTSDEEQGEGGVGWVAYKQYATAFSVKGLVLCFILSFLSNGLSICASWWLGIWSKEAPENQIEAIGFYFGIYSLIMAIVAVCGSCYTYVFLDSILRAATVLHDNILNSVMKAPMSFFDTTPTGRILNRFSADVDTLCDSLPVSFADAMLEIVIIITGFAACTIATPLYVFLILPLSVPYVWLQRRYLGTSRDLRRLTSITRSPIFQLLDESLDGLPTLRSYGVQLAFIDRLISMLDLNNNARITNLCSSRWFDVRIDVVGLLTLFISAALCILSKGHVDPGLAGLALIYASSNAGYLSFFVQDFCLVEVNIVAVERINEYVDCPKEIEGNQTSNPRAGWPTGGNLEFKNYSTRYRPGLDLVLKNLNFSIKAGERVGIVGRTGSGKSSLVLALTRILEAAEGSIELDGVDVSKLELENLRRHITVVPQEPVLFATTIRENLDPFKEFDDGALWNALEKTRMKEWAQNMPEKLDSLISEGGSNLSVGERQLICMARALLQKAAVLVLDEATSSIDIKTDELIQTILREEFTESSLLVVAHRLNTILDSDRILVLDGGRVCEFDSPARLLANPDSVFAGLCKKFQDH